MKKNWTSHPNSALATIVVSCFKIVSRPYRLQIGNSTRLELPRKNGRSCSRNLQNKMTSELEEKLFNDFPKLFFEDPETKQKPTLYYGIECGDGWEHLIRSTCETLSCRGTFIAGIKQPFFKAYSLDVGLHNISRKIEKKLNLKTYSLYSQKLNRRYGTYGGYITKITQIKEKFGGLRMYYEIHDNFNSSDVRQFDKASLDRERSHYVGWVAGITGYAEALSEKTCEHDGSPGQLYSKGWWKTLCPECAIKAQKI